MALAQTLASRKEFPGRFQFDLALSCNQSVLDLQQQGLIFQLSWVTEMNSGPVLFGGLWDLPDQ